MEDLVPVTPKDTSVTKWNFHEVAAWFQGYIPLEKIREQKIDGPALLELTREDLEEDLGITDQEQLEVILANIDNLKLWERKNVYLDEELANRPVVAQDYKWTSFGPLFSPGIVVMGNNDHNGEVNELGKEDCSGGYLFAVLNDGTEFFRATSLEITNDLGRDSSLAVDPEMRWLYTSESGSNCIRKWNFDGKVLQTLSDVHGPLAIDPSTHNVWVLVQTGCIATGVLRIYSSSDWRWRVIKELPIVGMDIQYDCASRAMWIVGRKLIKISVIDYTELFCTDFTSWNPLCLSVDDTEPDIDGNEGCVWAVEGCSGSAGCARLAQYALDGTMKNEWKTHDKHVTRVSKDMPRQGVWVVYSKPRDDELGFIDRVGEHQERFPANEFFEGKRLDNIYLDAEGKVWVIAYSETKGHDVVLYRFDPDREECIYRTELPDCTTIAWMTGFSSTESFEGDFKAQTFEKLQPKAAPTPQPRHPTTAATPCSQQRPSSAASRSSPLLSPYRQSLLSPEDQAVDLVLERLATNVGQIPLTDEQLRAVFNQYDVDGNGFLSKREVKQIVKSYESYGVDSGKHINDTIDKMNMLNDGTICFDEFAIIMLKLAQQ
eukprot:TRINITY_DN67824_c1_g1_i1.p1 TRINITY_DN67824_c1_g1~~TRINITY_DN67824_c1_g1_i1.p1  ORF type:complete len:602 (-),score=56.94 TRINITY_DN67824_c1_g1_i1:1088-2893(-)